MKILRVGLTILAAVLACVMSAQATFTISGSVGGAPSGVNKVNFDNLPLGSAGGTAVGPNGSVNVSFVVDGQAVAGAVQAVYVAPLLSGGNGNGFGPSGGMQANGADATTYLTSGISTDTIHGQAILTFSGPEKYIGLLWGSVDAFNTLSFYNGNTLIGAVTGSDVTGSPNGAQTLYVNINSDIAFDRVIATSTQYALEFDNVAYNPNQIVPEPTTMISGALLLLPFGVHAVRSLRKNRPASK